MSFSSLQFLASAHVRERNQKEENCDCDKQNVQHCFDLPKCPTNFSLFGLKSRSPAGGGWGGGLVRIRCWACPLIASAVITRRNSAAPIAARRKTLSVSGWNLLCLLTCMNEFTSSLPFLLCLCPPAPRQIEIVQTRLIDN
jgi:hypothetical protein